MYADCYLGTHTLEVNLSAKGCIANTAYKH